MTCKNNIEYAPIGAFTIGSALSGKWSKAQRVCVTYDSLR